MILISVDILENIQNARKLQNFHENEKAQVFSSKYIVFGIFENETQLIKNVNF